MAGKKGSKAERVILGLDPGTAVMGYGLIAENQGVLSLISLGVIRLEKYENQALKLTRIFERTRVLIAEYLPDCVALEDPFYGKNVQVMLKLGRAQGVAMAAALEKEIPIFEYAPKKIKQSITGRGSATKEQVAAMLKQLLKFEESGPFLDATDGLAVAVCHAFQNFVPGGVWAGIAGKQLTTGVTKSRKSVSSWEAFVKENPSKVK